MLVHRTDVNVIAFTAESQILIVGNNFKKESHRSQSYHNYEAKRTSYERDTLVKCDTDFTNNHMNPLGPVKFDNLISQKTTKVA